PAGPPPATQRSVCVVEGAALEEVKGALGDLAANPGLHLQNTGGGMLFYSDAGETGPFLHTLARALPAATVYRLVTGPAAGRLGVLFVRGPVDVGYFETPDISSWAKVL